MDGKHLIGFSLSLCFCDILDGRVKEEEVHYIQTGCAVRDTEDVAEVLASYCRNYWKNNTIEAIELFHRLRADHRIGWANTWEKKSPNIAWGHWLSTKNAVRFGISGTTLTAALQPATSC